MKPRSSLFGEHEREDRRTKLGDPLLGLSKHVNFEALAASVDEAAPRARVEHVFGALAQMGVKLVRCIGMVRTSFALNLKAATYNLKRLVFLKEGGLAPF